MPSQRHEYRRRSTSDDLSTLARSTAVAVIILLLAGAVTVDGFSSGPPVGPGTDELCFTMLPRHGSSSQTSPPPYTIRVTDQLYTPYCYVRGQPVTVTLSGTGGSTFRGFFMQARLPNNNASFGTFVNSDRNSGPLSCYGQTNNAIGHTSSSNKASVTFTWTPPSSLTGTITLITTVVQNYITIWVQGVTFSFADCDLTALQPETVEIGGSLAVPVQGTPYLNGSLFGSNVTLRDNILDSQATKAWINGDIILPDCQLVKYYIYVNDRFPQVTIDSNSRRIRLQVWRPYSETFAQWQLVWEQVVTIYPNYVNALYVYSVANASSSFAAQSGDRIGWAFEGNIGAIAFSYVSNKNSYFQRGLTPLQLPAIGQITQFDSISLPTDSSVAVLVNRTSSPSVAPSTSTTTRTSSTSVSSAATDTSTTTPSTTTASSPSVAPSTSTTTRTSSTSVSSAATDTSTTTPSTTTASSPSVAPSTSTTTRTSSTSVSSAATDTSTTTPSTTTGCSQWTSIERWSSINGVKNTQYNTVSSCQNYCVSLPSCVAIDFNNLESSCWIHTSLNNLAADNSYPQETVTQYQLSRTCASTTKSTECTQTWQRNGGYRSPGATRSSISFSEESCLTECVSIPSCVAIDLNNFASPVECWIHTDIADLGQSELTPGFEEYVLLSRCSPVVKTCSETWQIRINVRFAGGTQYPTFTSSDQCLNLCLSLTTCVAFDFGSRSFDCWIHTNVSDLSSTIFAFAYTQHVLVSSRCSASSPSVAPSTSTTTRTSSTSISSAATDTSTTTPSTTTGCLQWTSIERWSSINGVKNTQYNTVSSCQDYCVSLPSCVAIDFNNLESSCWIHTSLNNLAPDNSYPQETVTQYQLSRTCSSTTETSVCAQWSIFQGRHSLFAEQQSAQYNTINTCQALCISTPTCVALDFNFVSASCWLHFNINNLTPANTYTDDPLTTQYVLSRSCVTFIPSCIPTWQAINNQNSDFGIRQPTYLSLSDCQYICVSSPQCVALDYDNTSLPCWLHTNSNDLTPDNTYGTAGVTQYILSRQCVSTTAGPTSVSSTITSLTTQTTMNTSTTTRIASTSTTTTQPITSTPTSVTTLSTTSTPTSTSTTSPTQSTTSTSTSTTSSRTTSTQTPTRTSTTTTTQSTTSAVTMQVTCIWSLFTDTNVANGVARRELTLDACQMACVNTPFCIGIDIDTGASANYCWLTVLPAANGPLTTFIGVNHYVLTRQNGCPFFGVSPTPGTSVSTITTTSTPTTSTTSRSTTRTTVVTSPPGCFMRKTRDANADAGILIGSLTEDQCTSYCLNQYPLCLAVDYNSAERSCYVHRSTSGINWNSCCVRYEIACASLCTDTFALFSMSAPSNFASMSPTTGVSSVAGCQNTCLSSADCIGFVWITDQRPSNQKCIIYRAFNGQVTATSIASYYARQICQPFLVIDRAALSTASPPPSDFCVLDVVLVVDLSGSILTSQTPGVDNLQLIKDFLIDVVDDLQIGVNFDRVGLVTFESSAAVRFTFLGGQTLNQVTSGINLISSPGGETNTPAGLEVALQMLQQASQGARSSANKVIILLTDGHTSELWQPNYGPIIARLINANIIRIAIGVSNDIDENELLLFVSSPSYLSTINNFNDLLGVTINTVNAMLASCQRSTQSTISTVTPASTTSTPTSTSRSTSTGTTPTSTSTTTTLRSTSAMQIAFSFAANSVASQPSALIPLPVQLVNPGSRYSNSVFTTTFSGIHFVEVCVAVTASTKAQVRTLGGSPTIGINWESTSHDGVDGQCRASLLSLTTGVRLNLNLISGVAYSDSNQLTALSVFSLSDSMFSSVPTAVFAIPRYSSSTTFDDYLLQMGTPIVAPTVGDAYNTATSVYTCQSNTPHFFSVSAGVGAGDVAQLQLVGASIDVSPVLQRSVGKLNGVQYNGVTTLGRNFLLRCNAQYQAYIVLQAGKVTNGPDGYQLMSLVAFPYLPSNVVATSWALYRSTSVDARFQAVDPIPFDQVEINQNGLFSSSNGLVTIRENGYYYVYMSVAAESGQFAIVRLKRVTSSRIESTLLQIRRTSTISGDYETLGRGSILLLNNGDQLGMVAERPSFLYSGANYDISFFGMLLYYV